MLEQYFPEIKIQIDEYYEFSLTTKSDKYIFSLFPKVLVLSIASLFEKQIKAICSDVVLHPNTSLFSITALNNLVNNNQNRYINAIYGKIAVYTDSLGQEQLSMEKFYKLFGDVTFKNRVRNYYTNELSTQITSYQEAVEKAKQCADINDRFLNDYIILDDILQRLNSCCFEQAQEAFLKIKFKRNIVAHDFTGQFNDSYNDILNLYYDAALFVYALKKALTDLVL